MPKVTIDIEQLKKLIAEHEIKTAVSIVPPPLLKAHIEQWSAYPKTTKITVRQSDIDGTMDAIVAHLEELGVSAECIASFKLAGALRQNIIDHAVEDQLPLCMQQLLHYITIISLLPDAERTTYLMKFPPRDAVEFNCLLGTMERMDSVLQELQMQSLPPEEKALLGAYFSVIEAWRRRCAPEFSDGNQPHAASAVAYLAGFDDINKMGPAMSFDIRASTAWAIYCNHVTLVNAELKQSRDEHISKLMVLVTAEHPDHSKITQLSEELSVNLGEFCDASDEDTVTYDAKKIPELFPEIELMSQLNLSFDLFDEHAPVKIAELLCSTDLTDQTAALKALRLLGHQEQRGGSVIQFLRSFYEMGIKQGKAPAEAMTEGLAFFNTLKEKPLLSKEANVVISSLELCTQGLDKDALLIQNYISYMKGEGVLPTLDFLLRRGAPLTLITTKLETIEASELLEFFTDTYVPIDTCFFRPDAEQVLCCLMSRTREILSPAQYGECEVHINGMGCFLARQAARFYSPKVLECVENNFNATKPSDVASYKVGLTMLTVGLFNAQMGTDTYNGASFLAIRDVKLLVEKLRTIISILGRDPVELLQSHHPETFPLSYTLAADGDLYALRQVFELVGPEEQEVLICDTSPQRNTPIEEAIIGGHVSVLNYFLSLKYADNTPLINLKENTGLMLTAVGSDQVGALSALIAAGADITATDVGMSLIYRAAERSSINVIKYLASLEHDGKHLMSLDDKTAEGNTPLMIAVLKGNTVAIDALVAAGATFSPRNNASLLHFALCNGQEKLIPFLLDLIGPKGEQFIDIEQRNNDGWTALAMAVSKGCKEAITVLIAAGADASMPTTDNAFLLSIAAENGYVEQIPFLLSLTGSEGEPAIDINQQDDFGYSALLDAVYDGNQAAITALITANADVNLCTFEGNSLLYVALLRHQEALFPFLLDFKNPDGTLKIDIDLQNKKGWSAVALAVHRGQKTAVEALVAAGANVTLCPIDGRSLLHIAIKQRHLHLLPFILGLKGEDDKPALDVNGVNLKGITPLTLLLSQEDVPAESFIEAVKILLLAGAELSSADREKFTNRVGLANANTILPNKRRRLNLPDDDDQSEEVSLAISSTHRQAVQAGVCMWAQRPIAAGAAAESASAAVGSKRQRDGSMAGPGK